MRRARAITGVVCAVMCAQAHTLYGGVCPCYHRHCLCAVVCALRPIHFTMRRARAMTGIVYPVGCALRPIHCTMMCVRAITGIVCVQLCVCSSEFVMCA